MTLRSGREVEAPNDNSQHPRPKRARYETAFWDDEGDLQAVLRAAADVRELKKSAPTRLEVLTQLTADGSFTPDHAQRAVGRAIGLGELVVAEDFAAFLFRCGVSSVPATLAALRREAIIVRADLDGITARDLAAVGIPLGDATKISRGLDE